MTDQRLYIDGELVDLGEDTKFTLSIKSNLFREISDIVSNNSYTIKLPKTVRNQRILGHSDLVQNGGSTFPYKYHTAQYFRNGVQLIRNGRAAVMSVTDDFEISIVWGIYPTLADIIDKDYSLKDLGGDEVYLRFTRFKFDSKVSELKNGYLYIDYNAAYVDGNANDDTWINYQYRMRSRSQQDVTLDTGAVFTGKELGKQITPYIDKRKTDYISQVLIFRPGSSIRMAYTLGGDDYRAYAILDINYNIIELAPAPAVDEDGNITEEARIWAIDAPANSMYLVINVYVPASSFGSCMLVTITDDRLPFINSLTSLEGCQPVATVKWILEQIKETWGVEFMWPEEAQDYIDMLAIPLIEAECGENTFIDDSTIELNGWTNETLEGDDDRSKSFLGSFNISGDLDSETYRITDSKKLNVLASVSVQITAKAEYSWSVNGVEPDGYQSHGGDRLYFYDANPCYIVMRVIHGGENDDVDEYVIGNINENEWERHYSNVLGADNRFGFLITGYGNVDLEEGDVVEFELRNMGKILQNRSLNVTNGVIRISQIKGDDVPYGGYFPIKKNLPDVSVVDFIKTLCVITGSTPSNSGNGDIIKIAGFDNIKTSSALDWTSKVIASSQSNVPDNIEFTMDGYARHNLIKWKEDETVTGNYDGDILIENGRLDESRDIFELPFAASDYNIIPIYDMTVERRTKGNGYEEYVNKREFKRGIKPRIMNIVTEDDGDIHLEFNMDLQKIIDEKYGAITSSLRNPKIIKETFALSDIDIMDFDETKPVYLAQYGAYFAVTEIQVNEDGTSDVTMFQLVKVN